MPFNLDAMTGALKLEIATSDFESTKQAVLGGADRIELCANLGEGGTTQSYGVIKKCRESFDVRLYPIIRVRGGDFFYTDDEFDCMLYDAIQCKDLNCDGVVIGFLNRDGSIDRKRTEKIIQAVYPLGVTFHRAFDRCLAPFDALEQLIDLGCERVLTSGQELTAPEGARLIAELNRAANNRIVIMPGSGVRSGNIVDLAAETQCREFHTSLRALKSSEMTYFPEAFEKSAENDHYTVEALAVREMKQRMSEIVI
ncbi:copper homeostasis protein CutC [Niabella insulamsoli]|uniref:copper homeostasis protein CutC n=1 Tax=Niabella insulamsoli TaxID=3144874 RepID=UPI0031FDE867